MTVILTTHYIEEAEEMADRVGVIHKGEIILVEDKAELMRKLGKKQLALHLHRKLDAVPPELAAHRLELKSDGSELIYSYDTQGERTESPPCCRISTAPASVSGISTPRKARWRTSSSTW